MSDLAKQNGYGTKLENSFHVFDDELLACVTQVGEAIVADFRLYFGAFQDLLQPAMPLH